MLRFSKKFNVSTMFCKRYEVSQIAFFLSNYPRLMGMVVFIESFTEHRRPGQILENSRHLSDFLVTMQLGAACFRDYKILVSI